jgi:hypothetical protein
MRADGAILADEMIENGEQTNFLIKSKIAEGFDRFWFGTLDREGWPHNKMWELHDRAKALGATPDSDFKFGSSPSVGIWFLAIKSSSPYAHALIELAKETVIETKAEADNLSSCFDKATDDCKLRGDMQTAQVLSSRIAAEEKFSAPAAKNPRGLNQ